MDLNDIDDCQNPVFSKIAAPSKKKKVAKKVQVVQDSFEYLTIKPKKAQDFGPQNSTEECLGLIQSQMSEVIEQLQSQQELVKQKAKQLKQEREKLEQREEAKIDPKKHIFATMMTDDSYIQGVQVLNYSLQKWVNDKIQSYHERLNKDLDEEEDYQESPLIFDQKFQLIVLVTQNISVTSLAVLKKLPNIIIKKVNSIPNPHETTSDGQPCWTGSGYTKLHIWGLVEYDLVFYIDADCLIQSETVLEGFQKMIKNEESQLAAAPDVFPPDNFNAGVLVIRPSMSTFKDLLSKIDTLPAYDGGDTGFLNSYFPDWFDSGTRLPYTFNCQRILQIFTQKRTDGYWNEVERKKIKILHYSSSPKPWVQTICQADQIWKQNYMEYVMKQV